MGRAKIVKEAKAKRKAGNSRNIQQATLLTSRAGGRRSGRRIQHPRFSIWSGALPSRRYDRSAKAEMRTLVCSYTSNVAFCRVLSRFGVFVASFLACARATGMQVAGCWRPCGPFWHLLALFGTLFSGARGAGTQKLKRKNAETLKMGPKQVIF